MTRHVRLGCGAVVHECWRLGSAVVQPPEETHLLSFHVPDKMVSQWCPEPAPCPDADLCCGKVYQNPY